MAVTPTRRCRTESGSMQGIAQVAERILDEFREELLRHARVVSATMTQFNRDTEGMPERDQMRMLRVMTLQYNVTHEAVEAMDHLIRMVGEISMMARHHVTK